MQSIDNRGQAVCRAGSIGNHGHIFGQDVLVNAINHRSVHTLTRSGNQHFLSTAFQVSQALFLGTECARAFEHNVHAQFFPGKIAGIAVAEHAHAVAINNQVFFRIRNFLNLHFVVEVSVNRVMTQQMSIGLDVTHGVNGHNFDIVLFAQFIVGAQHVTTDAAKTRNGNFNGHFENPLFSN